MTLCDIPIFMIVMSSWYDYLSKLCRLDHSSRNPVDIRSLHVCKQAIYTCYEGPKLTALIVDYLERRRRVVNTRRFCEVL